jgi:hypothetical protein
VRTGLAREPSGDSERVFAFSSRDAETDPRALPNRLSSSASRRDR